MSETKATTYTQDDPQQIADLLIGRRIVTAEKGEFDYPGRRNWDAKAEGRLTLDDGTALYLTGHDGGCGCNAGCYPLSVLNGVDNAITRVEFDFHPASDGDPYNGPNEAKECDPEQEEYTGHYRIFVFADNERVNLAQFDGTDGNGYYGTGFELTVVRPEASE